MSESKKEDEVTFSKARKQCEENLVTVLKDTPKVAELLNKIEEMGCKLPKDFFACRPCEGLISGGFGLKSVSEGDNTVLQPQVILCENTPGALFPSTVIHELVHAYDVCRAKMNFDNCLQHACTEVRASTLSGECDMLQEVARGNLKLYGGHPACVSRRATLSVSMNPRCKDVAEEAVKSAMVKCYPDRSPWKKED
eukprot:gene8126-8965_t